MLLLNVIHDLGVLRHRYALISLAACRNSRIPYDTNATYPQFNGRSQLCEHPPCRHWPQSPDSIPIAAVKFMACLSDVPIEPLAQIPRLNQGTSDKLLSLFSE